MEDYIGLSCLMKISRGERPLEMAILFISSKGATCKRVKRWEILLENHKPLFVERISMNEVIPRALFRGLCWSETQFKPGVEDSVVVIYKCIHYNE